MNDGVVADGGSTVTCPAPGRVRVTVEGPLDKTSASRFRELVVEALSTHGPSVLELDLAAAPDIDSTGLGVLRGAYRRGESVSCKVLIVDESPTVRRARRILKFPSANDVDETNPAPAPEWPADDDRHTVRGALLRTALTLAQEDMASIFTSLEHGSEPVPTLDLAVHRLLDVAGALSTGEAAWAGSELPETVNWAAYLARAQVVVSNGKEFHVRLGYVTGMAGYTQRVRMRKRHVHPRRLLRAMELETAFGSLSSPRLMFLCRRARRIDPSRTPDTTAAAYTRVLAEWVYWLRSGSPAPDALITRLDRMRSEHRFRACDGEFTAELAMMSALARDDDAALETATRQALAWHRGTTTTQVYPVPGSLIAFRPLALVNLASATGRWPLTVRSWYLPPRLVGLWTQKAQAGRAPLRAVPMTVPLRDAAFREVSTGHGIDTTSRPLEPEALAQPDEPGMRSPAALLRAHREVVAFRGREELLGRLGAWCESGRGFDTLLVHGPGGQGKTRLARELANRLPARRWETLWLRDSAPGTDVSVLATAAVPLLIVVDYAENRADLLTRVIEAVKRAGGGEHPIRLLLLARTAGDWLSQVATRSPVAAEHPGIAEIIELPALEPEPDDRDGAYRAARTALARHLPSVPTRRGHPAPDWARLDADLRVPRWTHRCSAGPSPCTPRRWSTSSTPRTRAPPRRTRPTSAPWRTGS